MPEHITRAREVSARHYASADTRAAVTNPGQASAPKPTAIRLAGLEGPRGIGSLCVILAHCAIHFAPKTLAATRIDFLGQALTFFFVLSGFLLFLPYVDRLFANRARPKTTVYLANRLRRVFPTYLVIFLIVNFGLHAAYVVNPITGGWSNADGGTGTITKLPQLLANLTLTQSLFPATLQTGINPAWSLTTEWGFYLALPLICAVVFAFAPRVRQRRTWSVDSPAVPPYWYAAIPGVAMVMCGVAFTTVIKLLQAKQGYTTLQAYWGSNGTAALSRSTLTLADAFGFGMIAAVGYVALRRGALAHIPTRTLSRYLGAATIGFTLFSLALFVVWPVYLSTVFGAASCFFILWIIAPLARGEHSTLATITDWKPAKSIGIISLSVYLWHYPVIIMVSRHGAHFHDSVLGLMTAFALVAGITLPLGALFYYGIEKPAMKYLNRKAVASIGHKHEPIPEPAIQAISLTADTAPPPERTPAS